MSILEKHFEFVKDQIEFHSKQGDKYSAHPYRFHKHTQTKNLFVSLLNDLEDASKQLDTEKIVLSNNRPKHLRLSLSPEEIEDLPEELIQELSISNADRAEFAILSMLEDAGGIMSLDQIIVGLYKQTGEIPKRTAVTNRLYRMAQKETIYSVSGKKGVYSLYPLTEKETIDMFGDST